MIERRHAIERMKAHSEWLRDHYTEQIAVRFDADLAVLISGIEGLVPSDGQSETAVADGGDQANDTLIGP